MKYKVGDRVRIKSLDWYNENKDENREIKFENGIFTTLKSIFLGQIMTIEEITLEKQYILMEDRYKTLWTDEMIEGLAEGPAISPDAEGRVNEFVCPDGYEFRGENGNVINATKIVLEKKKKEYPKTYKECCKVLEIEGNSLLISTKYITDYERGLWNLTGQLHGLIICRDAYWKIAGEEMGLGKPWKPDWENSEERRYSIVNIEGDINLPGTTLTKWILKVTNKILVFPTEEMRDAFYENFKELIEQCKELL